MALDTQEEESGSWLWLPQFDPLAPIQSLQTAGKARPPSSSTMWRWPTRDGNSAEKFAQFISECSVAGCSSSVFSVTLLNWFKKKVGGPEKKFWIN